jgi:hypothetical protein
MLNNPEPIQKIPSGHHYNALSCTKQDSFLYIMYAFYDVFPTYVITLYDAWHGDPHQWRANLSVRSSEQRHIILLLKGSSN